MTGCVRQAAETSGRDLKDFPAIVRANVVPTPDDPQLPEEGRRAQTIQA
jgi:hypothetical protein